MRGRLSRRAAAGRSDGLQVFGGLLVGVLCGLRGSGPAHAATFTVTSAADTTTASACANATAQCTLREAILEANATVGLDTIVFSTTITTIPVGDSTLTPLPVITQPVII